MTDRQIEQVHILRKQGIGYGKVAQMLGVSENTVKSYCRRNALTGSRSMAAGILLEEHFCPNCGMQVLQTAGRKEKRFCSDRCRNAWWNAHLGDVQRKAIYEFECAYCHQPFTAYGNANRKYCSHECYVKARFGGDKHE